VEARRAEQPRSRASAAVDARVLSGVPATAGSELARLLAVRVPDLIDYQDERYACAYAAFVERIRAEEQRRVPGSSAVTEAVARNLYKLMAYKGEYEVARLSLDPVLDAEVEQRFGAGARYSYRLHPPVLRAIGLRRKLTLGPWFRSAFRVLRSMRRLRGTRMDLFGYAAVRRVERELIAEYREAVESVVARLEPHTSQAVVELADLPDLVRGYEDVELRSAADYRERLAEMRARLLRAPAEGSGVGWS
ncbi:MAG: indolepyruvate ferredoxin oxidoreductase, partial [Pseudonocardiales bacterium]|nr:indolepyruvate ferredoxin oxidoreductase [Pseudonocardiales bacterium]